MIRQGVMK